MASARVPAANWESALCNFGLFLAKIGPQGAQIGYRTGSSLDFTEATYLVLRKAVLPSVSVMCPHGDPKKPQKAPKWPPEHRVFSAQAAPKKDFGLHCSKSNANGI